MIITFTLFFLMCAGVVALALHTAYEDLSQ